MDQQGNPDEFQLWGARTRYSNGGHHYQEDKTFLDKLDSGTAPTGKPTWLRKGREDPPHPSESKPHSDKVTFLFSPWAAELRPSHILKFYAVNQDTTPSNQKLTRPAATLADSRRDTRALDGLSIFSLLYSTERNITRKNTFHPQ